MGGEDARTTTARGGDTKRELYARARRRGVRGRSKMTKRQLQNALAR